MLPIPNTSKNETRKRFVQCRGSDGCMSLTVANDIYYLKHIPSRGGSQTIYNAAISHGTTLFNAVRSPLRILQLDIGHRQPHSGNCSAMDDGDL